jgi:hypothetical protein
VKPIALAEYKLLLAQQTLQKSAAPQNSPVDTLFKIKPFSIIFNHEFSEIGMA